MSLPMCVFEFGKIWMDTCKVKIMSLETMADLSFLISFVRQTEQDRH